MREKWIFLKSPGNEVDALVFLLNRFQCSDGLNRAKQRVDIADSAFLSYLRDLAYSRTAALT